MLDPEEQQIEICILKFNLDEVEESLEYQRSTLPALDAVNNQKYRQTKRTQQKKRSFNNELERLQLENVKLRAKLNQCNQQNKEISESLETATQLRDVLMESVKQQKQIFEKNMHNFEDSMKKKAQRFRMTHRYYNEEEVNKEIDKENAELAELKDVLSKKKITVAGLRAQLGSLTAIHQKVPENIHEIAGKLEVEEKAKLITKKFEDIEEKIKMIKQYEGMY